MHTGVAIFQPQELISAPFSSDFTSRRRASVSYARALKRRPSPPPSPASSRITSAHADGRLFARGRRREHVASPGRVFSRDPTSHARIFGRFHLVTPNVLKIPTKYDGKIPFIVPRSLIHFVGRRDFRVAWKFRETAAVKSERSNSRLK